MRRRLRQGSQCLLESSRATEPRSGAKIGASRRSSWTPRCRLETCAFLCHCHPDSIAQKPFCGAQTLSILRRLPFAAPATSRKRVDHPSQRQHHVIDAIWSLCSRLHGLLHRPTPQCKSSDPGPRCDRYAHRASRIFFAMAVPIANQSSDFETRPTPFRSAPHRSLKA